MKVFFIRHGQTTANVDRIYAGQTDVKLTEEGRAQAEALQPILEKTPFDRVYSSDLSRAMDTAKLALPGCRLHTTALLREYDVGYVLGRKFGDFPPELEKEYLLTKNYALFGGESTQTVCDRVRQFQRILEQESFENVAVFAHNGTLNCMLRNVLGEVDMGGLYNKNCAINVFEYDGKRWRVLALNYMSEV